MRLWQWLRRPRTRCSQRRGRHTGSCGVTRTTPTLNLHRAGSEQGGCEIAHLEQQRRTARQASGAACAAVQHSVRR